jgi:GMP synthase-like glutamine amidotransferase
MSEKILVVDNGTFYGKAVKGIGELTINSTRFFNCPDEFCLVLFTGGADVDPSYYNDTSPNGYCVYNSERDKQEAIIYSHAIEHDIACIGICRGLQFINVMNGGKMMHHISGHEGGGWHTFASPALESAIRVNSLHHQMIIPAPYSHVIGHCPVNQSDEYIGANDRNVRWVGPELEAAYYPLTKSAGVQYHPEMMEEDTPGYKFFHRMAMDLVVMPKTSFIRKYVRGQSSGSSTISKSAGA